MNRFNSSKSLLHLDSHNSNFKKEKEEKKNGKLLCWQLFGTRATLRNNLEN